MIKNKKANFEYFVLETETVGIMLQGSELLALRNGEAHINDAFIFIDIQNNSVWIKNMFIKNNMNNAYSHVELRDRKLLMTKKQIKKWFKELKVTGITIIPLSAYFNKNNKYKLDIALAKGKKTYNKKDQIKEKDIKRQTERELLK